MYTEDILAMVQKEGNLVTIPDKHLFRESILEQVKRSVLDGLGELPVKVYLFGSWARQEERRTSDIDVAIWYDESIPMGTFAKIRLSLEESTIPYRVELIDLTKADSVLVNKVKGEGILWKDYSKE